MPRRFVSGALFGLLVIGIHQRADAAVIGISEPNNTPATAQNVDAFFTSDFSPDIGDITGANTSMIIPHVTIDALGAHADTPPEYDWYSFTVPFAGAVGIFDIDYGMDLPDEHPDAYDAPAFFDTNLELLDTDGTTGLTFNDDPGPPPTTVAGAGGSVHPFDSFIQYVFALPGLYYIGVGGCCIMDHLFAGDPVPGTPTYALQISIGAQPSEIPEPATLVLLGTGLAAVLRSRIRRRRAA